MIIIRQGSLDRNPKRYLFDCQYCGCIFECVESEVTKESARYNEIDVSYPCPTCEVKTFGRRID